VNNSNDKKNVQDFNLNPVEYMVSALEKLEEKIMLVEGKVQKTKDIIAK